MQSNKRMHQAQRSEAAEGRVIPGAVFRFYRCTSRLSPIKYIVPRVLDKKQVEPGRSCMTRCLVSTGGIFFEGDSRISGSGLQFCISGFIRFKIKDLTPYSHALSKPMMRSVMSLSSPQVIE